MLIDKDSYKFIHISCLFVGLSSNLLDYPQICWAIHPWLIRSINLGWPWPQKRPRGKWGYTLHGSRWQRREAVSVHHLQSPVTMGIGWYRRSEMFRVTNSKIDPEKTDRLKSRKLGRSWFYTIDLLELATFRRYLNSWPSMLFKSPKSGIPELDSHVALPENRIANDSHKSTEGACFFLLKWP